jgi:hypothetical protein
LLERLRQATSPGLEIDRELGSGAMGVVFLGRDPVLDRPVAIKVLRPEAATASSAERFLREARVLAKVDHPNIVTIHQAGQAGGLFYFVMDRIEGETLADRLARGPLEPAEVRRLGQDLLDALAEIHRAGVVHRDIKPANILLAGNRAVVTDFGIALDDAGLGSDRATPGAVSGTPAYMAPEQAMGLPATVLSDVFAAGATLYQAVTGQRFDLQAGGDWASVPGALAAPIRRALEREPGRRWPSAEAFRAALEGGASRRIALAVVGLAVAAAVIGGVLWSGRTSDHATPLRPRLTVGPLALVGTVSPMLRDSMQAALLRQLRGYPDFEVVTSGAGADGFRLEAVLHAQGPGLRLETALEDGGRTVATVSSSVGSPAQWSLLVDSTSDALVRAVLAGPLKGDPWLPSEALPRSPASFQRFLDGERALAAGRWEEADAAYLEAERSDSSCLLCTFRLEDVSRWLAYPTDSARIRSLWAAADRFPAHYRALILASRLPIAERLDALEAATQQYRDFDLVWYRYGEELFHRGPLVGRLRSEAREAIRHTLRIRPDFIPGWNHLAWIAIAEGDSVEADSAMTQYQRLESGSTGVSFAQLALVTAAFSWRFGDGPGTTGQMAQDPRVASSNLLLAGPRWLLGFEAWRGALWFGQRFAAPSGPVEMVRSGLVAVALADVALGRPDSAGAALASLRERVPDDATTLFAAGLPAVMALADADSLAPDAASAHAARLRRFLDRTAYRPAVRRAAAFLLGAVATAGGLASDRNEAMAALAGGDALAAADRALLDLLGVARAGGAGEVAAGADSILLRHPQLLDEQPATRTVMRFAASGWLARSNRIESAARVLRWVEHQDVNVLPSGVPIAAEIEWALTPFARWRESRLVDRPAGDRVRACRLYGLIAAAWSGGDATFRSRAAEAQSRAATTCGDGR